MMLRLRTFPDPLFVFEGATIYPNGTLEVVESAASLKSMYVSFAGLYVVIGHNAVSRVQLVKIPETKPDGTTDHFWAVYGFVTNIYIELSLEECPAELLQAIEWLEAGKGNPI